MNKWLLKKRLVFGIIILLMLMLTSSSGCLILSFLHPETEGWYHLNSDGTKVQLRGGLYDYNGMFRNYSEDFKGFFCYDTVDHGSNWRLYRYKSPQTGFFQNGDYFFFLKTVKGLDRTKRYYYLAALIHVPSERVVPADSSKSFKSGLPHTYVYGYWPHDGIVNFRGYLDWHGGAPSCEVWFKYGTTSDPDKMEWETKHVTLYEMGPFEQDSKDLTGYDKIWFCLFASNDIGKTHSSSMRVILT